jgi:hypothetical protein
MFGGKTINRKDILKFKILEIPPFTFSRRKLDVEKYPNYSIIPEEDRSKLNHKHCIPIEPIVMENRKFVELMVNNPDINIIITDYDEFIKEEMGYPRQVLLPVSECEYTTENRSADCNNLHFCMNKYTYNGPSRVRLFDEWLNLEQNAAYDRIFGIYDEYKGCENVKILNVEAYNVFKKLSHEKIEELDRCAVTPTM